MSVSFDIKFIMPDYKQCTRTGEACRACPMCFCSSLINLISNDTCYRVSFDIKCIRRDQKQRRNGEGCQGSPTFCWSTLINLITKDSYVVFYLSCIISRFDDEKTAKQMKSRQSFV